MNVKNISQESLDFVAELQEAWRGSNFVCEVTRNIVGSLVALDVHETKGPDGISLFSVATPRTTRDQKSPWEEASIGLFVGRTVRPFLSTRQVVSPSASTRKSLEKTLGRRGFEQWEKAHEGTRTYNLGTLALPYNVGMSDHVVSVSQERRVRVHNNPVPMVHAAGCRELVTNPKTITTLCHIVNKMLENPVVKITQEG